jgi:hypothetical protein
MQINSTEMVQNIGDLCIDLPTYVKKEISFFF